MNEKAIIEGTEIMPGLKVCFLETTSRIEDRDEGLDKCFLKQYLTLRVAMKSSDEWAEKNSSRIVIVREIGIEVTDISHNIEDWDNKWDDGEWREHPVWYEQAQFGKEADIPISGKDYYRMGKPWWEYRYEHYDILADMDAKGQLPERLADGKVFSADARIANNGLLYNANCRRVMIAFVPVAVISTLAEDEMLDLDSDDIIEIIGEPLICVIGNWGFSHWDDCDEGKTRVADFLKKGKLVRVTGIRQDYPDWVLEMAQEQRMNS